MRKTKEIEGVKYTRVLQTFKLELIFNYRPRIKKAITPVERYESPMIKAYNKKYHQEKQRP
jgi:hypothetical protein